MSLEDGAYQHVEQVTISKQTRTLVRSSREIATPRNELYFALEAFPPGRNELELRAADGRTQTIAFMAPHGSDEPFFQLHRCERERGPFSVEVRGPAGRAPHCFVDNDLSIHLRATTNLGAKVTIDGVPVKVGGDGEIDHRLELDRVLDEPTDLTLAIEVDKPGKPHLATSATITIDEERLHGWVLERFRPNTPVVTKLAATRTASAFHLAGTTDTLLVGGRGLRQLRHVVIGTPLPPVRGSSCGPYDEGIGMVPRSDERYAVVVYDAATGREESRATIDADDTPCPRGITTDDLHPPSITRTPSTEAITTFLTRLPR